MARHLEHGPGSPNAAGGERVDPHGLHGASTVLGVAAISSVLAGVSLRMTASGRAGKTDLGPITPDVLPDPASTDLANPPFPSGLTAEELQHLTTFDELDFTIFSGALWDRFQESHAKNIRVHFPDGHYTDGLDKHLEDMQAIFVSSPDAHIHHHPLRIAKGNLTCVTGVMAGTFTRPTPDGKGGQIQPTNRAWSYNMATVGVWNSDGTMDEEWLFYDDHSFYAALGIG
ncbi:ester cyclase [uncultured Jatrophihabitans sp.]|uniref:ester cyclase n=1 Tax=uncultured Jatrophihabitans sp. TaxID=1610747 RepID=UPI0035CA804E